MLFVVTRTGLTVILKSEQTHLKSLSVLTSITVNIDRFAHITSRNPPMFWSASGVYVLFTEDLGREKYPDVFHQPSSAQCQKWWNK